MDAFIETIPSNTFVENEARQKDRLGVSKGICVQYSNRFSKVTMLYAKDLFSQKPGMYGL